MKIQIKNIAGSILFEGDFSCIARALEAAVAASADLRSADLRSADLRSANLRSANLRSADLRSADLSSADLNSADLRSADLRSANLSSANLSSADLSSADLNSANLSSANLSSADLSSADLNSANLRSADLNSANLSSADLSSAKGSELAIAMTRILPEGEIVGWKKLSGGVIAKLLIPANAKRSHAFGRKCRAEFARVVELIDADGTPHKGSAFSNYADEFQYDVGKTVKPTEKFEENWMEECASGIHFFITREEAVVYVL